MSVDQRDNDPAVLLTYIAVALDRVEPIDRTVMRGLAAPGASIMGAVPRLVAALTQPVAWSSTMSSHSAISSAWT